MSLPPVVLIPGANIRFGVAPEEWEACLQAWISLTGLYLRLPSKQFSAVAVSESTIAQFLGSYYHEVASATSEDTTFTGANAQQLRNTCFRLARRICLEIESKNALLTFDFLADICHVHRKSAPVSQLMGDIWRRHESLLQGLILEKKDAIIKSMETSLTTEASKSLRQVADIMAASPNAATVLMTGSDFVDALGTMYESSRDPNDRKTVVATAYLGLLSLVKTDPPNFSLLTDHLYSLLGQADRKKHQSSLIADLVTNTPLALKLRSSASGNSADRLLKVLDKLETYRSPSIARTRHRNLDKPKKGKGKLIVNDEMHMHRMSLVTQVQDLFPDLGSGFVLKLLDDYEDDVEQVTAHLLEDSLPPRLRDMDRTEQAPVMDTSQRAELEHLAPRSTPPSQKSFFPQRRNVFDDDEFDRLEVDTSRLHLGKKTERANGEQPNKAAILSALAAFDSDDDERDDTYDVEDVGGTVDTAHPDGEPSPSAKVTQEENDMALFTAYNSSPELFGRAFNVRRGQARQALKAETGMTDEAIEGWAIMLQRDPKRLKRLEAQAGVFDGGQAALARTAYRESPGGTETEDSDAPVNRGGFAGRGRGRGRGSRGGANVAGPSNDANTAAAQRRKEASKGSRANHNRRDQRARKMARGGVGP